MTSEAEREADQRRNARQREQMVDEQIVQRGIRHADLLRAMRAVPRHRFVPLQDRANAYGDHPLPIGNSQTISQPYIVALMTNELLTERGGRERVLEIGTGCGYQTAILAELFARVCTVERIGSLAKEARRRLQQLGYENIDFYYRDGYEGVEEQAPFDAIIVTCAAAEPPPRLLRQLDTGGRMLIPIGRPHDCQTLTRFERSEIESWQQRAICGVAFVPMYSAVE